MIKSTITEAVKADLDARTEIGIKKYKHPLSPFMGEDGLQHGYEELLDFVQYVKMRLIEEKTPYQCYWKDRALAAEKKLAEQPKAKDTSWAGGATTSATFKVSDGFSGPFSGFFINLLKGAQDLVESEKKVKEEHEARKKQIDDARKAFEKNNAEFERLKKEREAGATEPVRCRHCGGFPIITSIRYAGWNWQLHCSSRVELCRTSSGRTLAEAVTYWNKSNA